jgi:hypothetical protein
LPNVRPGVPDARPGRSEAGQTLTTRNIMDTKTKLPAVAIQSEISRLRPPVRILRQRCRSWNWWGLHAAQQIGRLATLDDAWNCKRRPDSIHSRRDKQFSRCRLRAFRIRSLSTICMRRARDHHIVGGFGKWAHLRYVSYLGVFVSPHLLGTRHSHAAMGAQPADRLNRNWAFCVRRTLPRHDWWAETESAGSMFRSRSR